MEGEDFSKKEKKGSKEEDKDPFLVRNKMTVVFHNDKY